MSIRAPFISLIFLFLYSILPAQSSLTPTQQIGYEVLTAALTVNPEPQSLQIKIDNTGSATVNDLRIHLADVKGKLTLVYAEKNDTPLWLIQSPDNSTRENVLSWEFSDSTGVLSLYPFPYPQTYTLTLEVQVNLNGIMEPSPGQQYSVLVETSLVNGIFAATVTGRGNKITINK
jgi:biopolymer transport protein ExbD